MSRVVILGAGTALDDAWAVNCSVRHRGCHW